MPTRKLAVLFLLLGLGDAAWAASTEPFRLPDPPAPGAIRYRADSFEYLRSTPSAQAPAGAPAGLAGSDLVLKGHVVVEESTRTLRAGRLRMDLDERRGYASEGFVLEDGAGALVGDSGEYDFETHEGSMRNVSAEYPPWRVWGRLGEVEADRRTTFRTAYFTSCRFSPPDYRFRASKLRVRPKRYLYATNAFLFIGKIPVFYTPFFWASLDPKPFLNTKFTPGYDRRNGGVVKTMTSFDLAPSVYGKLYLDHYGKQRPGHGAELEYRRSEESRGVIYGYRVHERTGKDRYIAIGDLYQKLDYGFAVQSRLQAQDNIEFNNDYARANSFRVTPQLVNNGAISQQSRLGTFRLSFSRLDDRDLRYPITEPNGKKYRRVSESWPRLDYQSNQVRWKHIPFLYTFSAFKDSQILQDQDGRYRTGGGAASLTESYRLPFGLTFAPIATARALWENRASLATSFGTPQTLLDTWTGRYDLGTNVRKSNLLGSTDVSYLFTRRLKPDQLKGDAGAPDYGIEANALSLQETLRPNLKTLFRISSGYDLRRFRDRTVPTQERFAPIRGYMDFTPVHYLQLSAISEYRLGEGHQNFIFQGDVGDRLGTFLGLGFVHSKTPLVVRATPETPPLQDYIGSAEFGWAPASATWRVNGILRAHARTPGELARIGTLWVFEKELTLDKNFHDFHLRLTFRARPTDVKEVLARLDFRIGDNPGDRIVRKDWETEWFPWRRDREDHE